ncbi:GNAT family N-acetyltransferase [Halococcus hamelinensis]|uniref:GCN5-like N-acetyltransferase n=1 Tax=Halococcus hamelinensis 100A6 TaxID=1132509 RepID=M0M4M8_9EURY|nr:GNAT family N-acetyltransferase [Halococcus hamelinensis]EMA40646.1 GCN5-like N-acetyltransferase [Halococcus hamelinensis 100A6]
MEIRRLPAEEAAVRRYAEELWVPYNRELEAVVESHTLADDVDLVDEQVPWALEKLEATDYRIAVAIDTDEAGSIAGTDATLAGFIATDRDPCPSVFDRPDRVVVCDIYVREPYRGTGLAHHLMSRAGTRADEAGCSEAVLSVDVDNDRALAFYGKSGFEPLRHRMRVDVADLDGWDEKQ